MTAPAQVTKEAGPADGQAEEVVEQVLGLAQGDAQVSPAVAGQQAGPRADVGAWQFQVAAALAGLLAAPTAVDVPTVTMPLESGFGEIGHQVVLELTGGFEMAGAAMRALHRTDVVFDEDGAGRGLRSEKPGMLAVFLAAVIGGGRVGVVTAIGGALAALADVLMLVLALR